MDVETISVSGEFHEALPGLERGGGGAAENAVRAATNATSGRSAAAASGARPPEGRLGWIDWLRHGPFLAQLVVTRRCNLACAYCIEYDHVSPPVPFEALRERLEELRRLRTWAVCLTGGEPTLHPRLAELVGEMRRLGFHRRQIITNGYRLSRSRIDALNRAGLTDLQISIDGVRRSEVTVKVLDALRPRLERLAHRARFRVVVSAVFGAAPGADARAVAEFAQACGFEARVLVLDTERDRLAVDPAERAAYEDLKRRIGRPAREAGGYRDRLLDQGRAPFRCRAGARYLYVDEWGVVRWCAPMREAFGKDLLGYRSEDLADQFDAHKSCNETCTVGCARTASAYDEWRPQGRRSAPPGGPPGGS